MQNYPYVTDPRRRSVLPEPLQFSLLQLRSRFRRRGIKSSEVGSIVSGLSELPAGIYNRAAREIVDMADLHWQYEPERSLRSRIVSLASPAKTDTAFLRETPGLEYLYIFHGDGYLRAEALGKIDQPLTSAFFFNGIAYRLNDWAEPVRQAAQACAARVFPLTSAKVIAEGAFVLLQRTRHWQRWSKEASILEDTFSRSDVTQELAGLIERAATGSPSRVLTFVLHDSRMDPFLLELSQKAVQPPVRTVALKTLLQGQARWSNGFEKEWIDKSMGRSRQVVAYGRRPISNPVPIEALIAQGLADRAPMVRRVAADGLVHHRNILSNLEELVQKCAGDKTAAVRERALFILEERESAASQAES